MMINDYSAQLANMPGAAGFNAAAAVSHDSPAQRKNDFVSALAIASTGSKVEDTNEEKQTELQDKVRKAAEQLVASAFVLPMLQQMRNDPFKSDLMHGGSGEDLFGQMWDTRVADDMVKRQGFDLVDKIYGQIMNAVDGRSISAEAGAERGVDTHA